MNSNQGILLHITVINSGQNTKTTVDFLETEPVQTNFGGESKNSEQVTDTGDFFCGSVP
jgi:hypothetical protein